MFHNRSATPARARHVVCLDLVRPPGPQEADEESRADRCRRLLSYARATGWGVSHVYQRTSGRRPRPIAGLEPLPSEPVYYRTGVSAFSSRAFGRAMRDQFDQQLVIVALSLSPTAVGTALAAHDQDIAVTLIGDTLSRDACDASGIEAIETIARALVAPFVQVRAVSDLIDQRRGLRLVQA
jgi:isochorismate hydrolase